MNRFLSGLMVLILAAIVVGGCTTYFPKNGATDNLQKPQRALLRVGVTPNYPPMIYKLNGKMTGMETDFAARLGEALGRDVRFVELPWDRLVNALMEGQIDIIMSAMTITEGRQVRVNFADPYLKIGQVAMMRVRDASKYNSLNSIRQSMATIGVVKGTTGEAYVRNHFARAATVIAIRDPSEAPVLLNDGRIDLFVYDAPAIVWLVSENESTLKGFWEPLNDEYLAWAVSRDNETLLKEVNAALANWKKDGTVKEMVKKWLPYWKVAE